MPAGMNVRVEGDARKIEQIFRFDKELWKEIQKGVKAATDDIRNDARRNYPDQALSGWGPWIAAGRGRDLSYSGSQARSGVRSAFRSRRQRNFRSISGLVNNKNPAGAIYGLAGSKNRSGEFFGVNINRKHPAHDGWPRALTPAWRDNVDEARKEIARVVEKAIAKVNR